MSIPIASKTRPKEEYVLGIKVGTRFNYMDNTYIVISYSEYISDSQTKNTSIVGKYLPVRVLESNRVSYFIGRKIIDKLRSGYVNITD